MIPKLWLRTFNFRWKRRADLVHASAVADEITLAAAEAGPVTAKSLIAAVEEYAGIKITTRVDDLAENCVGFTDRSGNFATITISAACTTRQHTLAHELGHLALGHQHCATPDDLEPPEACEELWRYLSGQLSEVVDVNERQAEAFAERIVQLLPQAPDEHPHEVKMKAALLR